MAVPLVTSGLFYSKPPVTRSVGPPPRVFQLEIGEGRGEKALPGEDNHPLPVKIAFGSMIRGTDYMVHWLDSQSAPDKGRVKS